VLVSAAALYAMPTQYVLSWLQSFTTRRSCTEVVGDSVTPRCTRTTILLWLWVVQRVLRLRRQAPATAAVDTALRQFLTTAVVLQLQSTTAHCLAHFMATAERRSRTEVGVSSM
jgi:hypothetical protein